jgi:hypothetical protein
MPWGSQASSSGTHTPSTWGVLPADLADDLFDIPGYREIRSVGLEAGEKVRVALELNLYLNKPSEIYNFQLFLN